MTPELWPNSPSARPDAAQPIPPLTEVPVAETLDPLPLACRCAAVPNALRTRRENALARDRHGTSR